MAQFNTPRPGCKCRESIADLAELVRVLKLLSAQASETASSIQSIATGRELIEQRLDELKTNGTLQEVRGTLT